jgi:hypothetical protein
MRRIALWLMVCPVLCAQTRYARLGEVDGSVEAQIHPSEPWKPALRNTPLLESSSLRTGPSSHVEIELDEGSVLRLAENSACELSDYTRLSTGQRITQISLDRGVAYFSGESSWRDALVLSLPSAQVSIRGGSRVRMEAASDSTQFAVLEGTARVSSAAIDLDLREGKMLKLPLGRSDKFYLLPEISQLDSDTWSLTRDKLLLGDASRYRLPGLHYGIRDLDGAGEWIDTAEFGMAWKPKAAAGWVPFRDGKWQWYEGLGFTWIGGESWGWLPYHYGRWMLQPSQGWIWAPGERHAFKPGDVYWLRGSGLVGWGPLAPGESWAGVGTPALYLKTTSTFARYAPSADPREIDPAGFNAAPKDPLAAAAFLESLPSARISRDRVEFERSTDRPGVIRLTANPPPAGLSRPSDPGESHGSQPVTQAPPPLTRQVVQQTVFVAQPPPPPLEPIVDTYYLAPVYTGIIVLNPPEKKPPPKLKKSSVPAAPQPATPAQPVE